MAYAEDTVVAKMDKSMECTTFVTLDNLGHLPGAETCFACS